MIGARATFLTLILTFSPLAWPVGVRADDGVMPPLREPPSVASPIILEELPEKGPAALDLLALEPAAERLAAGEDLDELVEQLRRRLQESQSRDVLPLDRLAGDLEQARLDVERLAELLLRKEISALRQAAEQASTEAQMALLGDSLEAAEARLARIEQERERMERLATESAARVQDLAASLLEADDDRQRLEQSLAGTRATAEERRRELAAANQRIAEIDQEIAQIMAASAERAERYEAEVAAARSSVQELEAALRAREAEAARELAAREAEIDRLAGRQVRLREVLVRALEEFDSVAAPTTSAYERELLRRAEAASQARVTVLDNLGFRRDAQGNLLPPEIDAAEAGGTRGSPPFGGIEPAAGPTCIDETMRVDRPYLDADTAAGWQHFLLASVHFGDAGTAPDDEEIAAIIDCLAELAADRTFYLKLVGHTDSRGAASLNQALSLQRAQAVRDLLAEQVDIQPWRLLTQGRGPSFPIADNATAAGQALNRRVEVFAVKTAS